ncbi:MAG: periplasmic heavy metal sensor [Hyphomicrobiaceae bacterium]
MSASQQPRPSGRAGASRLFWVVLIASLAINLLIAGALIGRTLASHHGGWFGHSFGGSQRAFVRRLPEERRKAIRDIIARDAPKLAPVWRKLRQERREVARRLRADSFDRLAFLPALERLHTAEADARAAARPMLAEIAAVLSPEERRMFLRNQWRLVRLIGAEAGFAPWSDRDPAGKAAPPK